MFKYSWAACFVDHNNNGWQDLFLVSGNLKNDSDPNYSSPNFFYENNGDETFTDISGTINMGDETRGRNGIFGDYDNDGDLDALILNYNEPMHLRKIIMTMAITGFKFHWMEQTPIKMELVQK